MIKAGVRPDPERPSDRTTEEERRSQTIPGLLLSPGEAAVNAGTAARQEIEQVSQSPAHFPNHEARAVLRVRPASVRGFCFGPGTLEAALEASPPHGRRSRSEEVSSRSLLALGFTPR
jgi:hypothetical protein